MTSKHILKNDGKPQERQNFVKMQANKGGFGGKGGYKQAMRGEQFTNKIMAKKSNYRRF